MCAIFMLHPGCSDCEASQQVTAAWARLDVEQTFTSMDGFYADDHEVKQFDCSL